VSAWPSSKASRGFAALLRIGWQAKRQSGSHCILSRDGWPDFVFAFHDQGGDRPPHAGTYGEAYRPLPRKISSTTVVFAPKPTAVSKPTSSKTSQTDWLRVDALEDDDIDYSDIPEVTPEMFARAAVRKGLQPLAPVPKRITLRLDAEVLDWFKAQGRGYQERINSLLRAYMEAQRRR
jgi:uncharacterized protein (DUF4415 family)/predicted RNA binding protein YcfA (HicA-like mRNA interferase family)